MIKSYIILFVLWLLFGFLHSAMAATVFKKQIEKLLQKWNKYYRLFYSLFNAIFLGYILFFNFSIPKVFLWVNPLWLKIIFILFALIGFVLMAGLVKKYFFDLSGIHVFFKHYKLSNKLQTGGLNKFVRHPLYATTLLFTGSLFLFQPTVANLISLVSIFVYTYIGIFFEEKKLLKQFGKAYEEYARHHPKLFPKF